MELEYEVLEADSSVNLTNLVNESVAKGWKLQGGVSASISESDNFSYPVYAQAMIKETSIGESKTL